VNAKKNTLKKADALRLAREVAEIYAARGKKVVHIKMKDNPSDEELAAVLLGPTGNLRAPALRKGRKLLVGFNEELYAQTFGR
jgi:arsenate reductase-like glutaredoxin family protein